MPQRTPSLRSVSPRPGRYFHILKMNLDAERGTPLRYDHEVHHLILAPPSQVGNILLGAPSIGSKPRQASQIRRRGLRRERRSAEVFRRYRISFGIVHPGVSERVASAARGRRDSMPHLWHCLASKGPCTPAPNSSNPAGHCPQRALQPACGQAAALGHRRYFRTDSS
jgi:hypothetical protein